MAEATQYVFNHRELVTVLLKHQCIHEGTWQLLVNFGFAAVNVGPNPSELNPAAIIPVTGVGIQRATESNSLCVDASVVNPA